MSDSERDEREEEKAPKLKHASVRTWLGRIQRETKAHEKYRESADRAMKAYEKGKVYPIWWSNVCITQGAVFNRQPKPDVRRRAGNASADRNIALAIERCLSYQLDTTSFEDHSTRAVTEFLVAGLGVTRCYLKTETQDVPVPDPITGQPMMGEDGNPITERVVIGQAAPIDYTPWRLFRWEPCKDWEDCGWISFDRWMSGAEIKREFGVDISEWNRGGASGGDSEGKAKPTAQKYSEQHLVHEIWDKRRKQVITICGADKDAEPLEVKADPCELKDFFPCPRPMMFDIASGDLLPQPEYHHIEAMCVEIDTLTARIAGTVKGIKDVGLFDAAFGTDLARMLEEDDGARIPVPGLLAKLRGLKFGNVIEREDIAAKAEVLVHLVGERERAKQSLYEITGIADILMGATKASETATAQQLKSQWANVRLGAKMREISNHFRGVFRIQGELIAEHFEPAQIQAQSGVEMTPEMVQIMQSDLARCYAIDIESDSTIAQDEQQEKADRLEFLQAFTDYMAKIMPMVSQGMITADMAKAVLEFLLGSFRNGRSMEEELEKMPDNQQQLQGLQQQLQQAQQQGEQQAQQAQQMQADAGAQMQAMQQQLEQIQTDAQAAIDQQQQEIARLTAQIEQNNAITAQTKAMDQIASARQKNAQADKVEAETRAIASTPFLPESTDVDWGAIP